MYLMITDGNTTYGEISIATENCINNDNSWSIDVHGWVSIKKYTDFLFKTRLQSTETYHRSI